MYLKNISTGKIAQNRSLATYKQLFQTHFNVVPSNVKLCVQDIFAKINVKTSDLVHQSTFEF